VVVHDEISGATFHWGQFAFVRLEPQRAVAHILRVERPTA
jgi:starch synthase (maltosyl-transferring)